MDFWWTRLPLLVKRRWRLGGELLGDGAHVSVYPLAGALAPPAALLIGILLGALESFPSDLYSASVPVMAVLIVLSSVGAGIGTWAFAGYVFGDFALSSKIPNESFLAVRAGLLIAYAVLALLMILIPFARGRLGQLALPQLLRRSKLNGPIAIALEGTIGGGAVWLWQHAAPTLIRPAYTWAGEAPPLQAIAPLQNSVTTLVVAAALGSLANAWVFQRSMRRPEVAVRVMIVRVAAGARRSRSRRGGAIAAVLGIASTVLLLSGFMHESGDLLRILVAAGAPILLRTLALPRLPAWTRLVQKVPVALRLLIAGIASWYIGHHFVTPSFFSTSSFHPMLLPLALSMVAFFVLVPAPLLPVPPRSPQRQPP